MKNQIKNLVGMIPGVSPALDEVRGVARAAYWKHLARSRQWFTCPICSYEGPFADYKDPDYPITNTLCPRCDLYERHRLQYLVVEELSRQFDFSSMSVLHFAPEPRFERTFRKLFSVYKTADIEPQGVDMCLDLRELPIENESYDVVYASHVLEHIDRDTDAIKEIWRIVKPAGLAILPVPVVSPRTIDYPGPNPHEFGHVRAPGLDYFDRYRTHFSKVDVWQSGDFDEKFQLYTYENRTGFPNSTAPHRVPMEGTKHADYVPVCFKKA